MEEVKITLYPELVELLDMCIANENGFDYTDPKVMESKEYILEDCGWDRDGFVEMLIQNWAEKTIGLNIYPDESDSGVVIESVRGDNIIKFDGDK